MSYQDKVVYHSLDMLCGLTTEDEREHHAVVDRMRAARVDPVHVAVHIAGMLEQMMSGSELAAWKTYVFDQREKARLIAAADLPPEPGSPFGI